MTRAAIKADLDGTALSDQHIGPVAQAAMLAAVNDGSAAAASAVAAAASEAALVTSLGAAHLIWKSIAVGAGTSAEVDSGWDIPAGALVHDVLVQVNVAELTGTTKTLDVGLLSTESGGDADGFIDGISVAAVGIKRALFVATVGSNNTYLGAAGTHNIGAKLTGLLIAGEDTAAGGDGFAQKAAHIGDSVTSKSVSYSRGSTLTEFAGYIWIGYSLHAAV